MTLHRAAIERGGNFLFVLDSRFELRFRLATLLNRPHKLLETTHPIKFVLVPHPRSVQ